jgi:hypothetical protein
MKRPLHPYFQLPQNADGSLDIKHNLAIIICALQTQPHGQFATKEVLLSACEQVCAITETHKHRRCLDRSACEHRLQNPFIRVTKNGCAKTYALTPEGQQLIQFAEVHPVRHLTELLRRLQPLHLLG